MNKFILTTAIIATLAGNTSAKTDICKQIDWTLVTQNYKDQLKKIKTEIDWIKNPTKKGVGSIIWVNPFNPVHIDEYKYDILANWAVAAAAEYHILPQEVKDNCFDDISYTWKDVYKTVKNVGENKNPLVKVKKHNLTVLDIPKSLSKDAKAIFNTIFEEVKNIMK